jgi:anti-sigma factor RsiW
VSAEHVADLAAQYALGALGDDEIAVVENHLRLCPDCARLVGASERDVALIASMEAQHVAPRELAGRVARALRYETAPKRSVRRIAWPVAAASAAALLVGLLPSAYFWRENRTLHGAMLAQSEAMDRLAAAPHRTAAFRAAPGSPGATVVYAPDGSWYLIVVRGASKALAVAWMHDGRQTMLGTALPRGRVAMLYLAKSHRMDKLALMDGSRIVAQADLSWGKTTPNRPGARSG